MRTSMSHIWPLALVALAGCSAGEFTVSSACYSAEFELAIHAGAEGDGFLAIGGLAVGTDGTAYVLDGGEGSLIAFAPEGDELWRVRGEERGLTDLLEPAGLHRQGELLVFEDLAERRLSFWTEAGEQVGTLAVDSLELPGEVVWVASVGEDRVAAALAARPGWSGLDPEQEAFLEAEVGGPGLALVVAPLVRGRVDTLAIFDPPRDQLLHLQGYEIPVASPYAARPSFAVSPEGLIALAAGAEYRVAIHSPDGSLYAEIVGEGAAPEVTAADRRAFGRLLPDTLLVGQLEFPASHPSITMLATTADGDLLIRTSWTRRGEVRWDRWTMAGEFMGAFMLPASMQPVTGVGSLIYGREVDEVGAPHLAIYRLTGGARCPGPAAVTPLAVA